MLFFPRQLRHDTYGPGRHLHRKRRLIQQYKGHLKVRALFGVDAHAVGEVEKASQTGKLSGFQKLVHMTEHRTEVGGAAAGEGQVLHIAAKLLEARDLLVRAELIVALQNVDIEPAGKGIGGTQDGIGGCQKFPHQHAGGGHGGVDGDHKVLDALFLFCLRRLNEGHVAVAHEAVGVVDIVKSVRIGPQDFPRGGEAAQELSVVHIVPGGDG